MRRLFLFAAYFPDGSVPASDLFYLKALAACGDTVLVADSDLEEAAMEPLKPYTVHAEAVRHGEYDFGSYKRAYEWADNERILDSYDVVYLVNDSVYGPLLPLADVLNELELLPSEAFCMAYNPHHANPHMQSWFIGLKSRVARAAWMKEFLLGVCRQASKEEVCKAYENGLTRLVRAHGIEPCGLFMLKGRSIYNKPASLFKMGFPFVKKDSFRRHEGSLGMQLKYVCDRIDPQLRSAVVTENRKGLLTANPFRIAWRYLSYISTKI